MAELRPKQILREISRRWPKAWQQVKMFRSDKGKGLSDWPDWCYIPIAAGMAIATQGQDYSIHQAVYDAHLSPAVITAAAAWRVSQGVYRFDADLYNSLITQPLDDKLPCEALKRLPEWCVFIEVLSGLTFFGKPFSGFWAHLEKDQNDGREELRLVLMLNNGDNLPVPIHLGDWTLEEGIQRMVAESAKNIEGKGSGVNYPPMLVEDIEPLVQLVLYLCAENADMPQIKHPKSRVRMSGQVDVPREERYWTVGERIGAAFRRYRNETIMGTEDKSKSSTGGNHASPRPHIRRAHWHHYWTGPRQGEQKLILRWLPPIPIGVEDNNEGPVVIHPVKDCE